VRDDFNWGTLRILREDIKVGVSYWSTKRLIREVRWTLSNCREFPGETWVSPCREFPQAHVLLEGTLPFIHVGTHGHRYSANIN